MPAMTTSWESMFRRFFILASLSGFISVVLGPFGAHAFKSTLSPEMLATFETGVRYQMYHSFGLFMAGWVLQKYPHTRFAIAGWGFAAGLCCFLEASMPLRFRAVDGLA